MRPSPRNLNFIMLTLFALMAIQLGPAQQSGAAERPNVLMIAIDDLNDWVEPLGGHPDVKTPQHAASIGPARD